MEAAGDFSVWKWLAELLGPGGFVAFVVSAAEGWLIYKLLTWQHAEREKWGNIAQTERDKLLAKAEAERENLHAQCVIERAGWQRVIDDGNREKKERFRTYRKDIQDQFKTVNGFKLVIASFAKTAGDRRTAPKASRG